MEIQKCLQELLQDDNSDENGVQQYLDVIASKSYDSFLSFHGTKIPPPLLSKDEKDEMCEYRRKAVELEHKHVQARRQRHSNLLLKVKKVMDRCQRKNKESKTKTLIPEGNSSKNNEVQEKENIPAPEKIIFSKTNQVGGLLPHGSINTLRDYRGNYNSGQRETKWKESSNQNVKDDSSDSPSIFQKPKLHNSSSSPRRNKVDSDTSSMTESNSQTLQTLSLDGESTVSSIGTVIANSILHGAEHIGSEREIVTASDSLASTVLSMAFTDSSVASQMSAMESIQQTVRPVQRKLNMDNVNHNPNQSCNQSVKLLTSTPNDLQRPVTRSSQRTKKKEPYKHVSAKNTSETEQDRALEKLEMMRKKLMEEKERQIALIRQQELARLKKNRNFQKQLDLSHEEDKHSDEKDGYYDEQFSVRPASDMYSIPERSFEGSLNMRGDDQNEAESASDKENNLQYDPQQRIHHDMHSAVQYRQDSVGYGSPQAKRNSGDGLRASLYVRQEFLKQFEVVMDQGCDGRNKFSILTAYSRGFLTRCLLKAEKVQTIVKTIKDTSEFLADISKEGTSSFQDKSLRQRVHAQLVAAKQKLHDIFFEIPVGDRMAYITHSRNVAKEREERQRQQEKSKKSARKLSSATLKAMQRRVGEQNDNSDVKRTSTHSSPLKRKNMDIRVLKPVQSTKSPQLQDKGRLPGKRRPGTAPSPRHSIIKKNTYPSRPATAMTRQSNRKSISRRSIDSDSGSSSRKPSRMSLEGKHQAAVRRTIKANSEDKSASSKLPVRRSSLKGGQTYRVTRDDEQDSKRTTQQQYGRPSRLSLEGTHQGRQISVKQDPVKSNRPNTTSGARRITRSMAANFSKS